MSEIELLRTELAELRQEVRALRRGRWLNPGAIALVLVAIGLTAFAQQTPPTHAPTQVASDVTCKSLKIVDDAGKAMVQLGSDKDGGLVVVNGADARKRFFVAVENGAGFADWYDAAGARRATMFTGDKGNFEFRLNDQHENIGLLMAQNELGGMMIVKGPNGNDRLVAGIDNGGGYLDLKDGTGKLRQSLYISDKHTAQQKILGPDGSYRLLLTDSEEGGQAISYDANGKQRAIFPSPPK